jgi:hypothetical protein
MLLLYMELVVEDDQNDERRVHFAEGVKEKEADKEIKRNHARRTLQTIDRGMQLTYEDILAKTGVRIAPAAPAAAPTAAPHESAAIQNSYIHNKYFNKQVSAEPEVRRPTTVNEYALMILHDMRQQQRMRKMKPTRMAYK